jgi:hypothetical protein
MITQIRLIFVVFALPILSGCATVDENELDFEYSDDGRLYHYYNGKKYSGYVTAKNVDYIVYGTSDLNIIFRDRFKNNKLQNETAEERLDRLLKEHVRRDSVEFAEWFFKAGKYTFSNAKYYVSGGLIHGDFKAYHDHGEIFVKISYVSGNPGQLYLYNRTGNLKYKTMHKYGSPYSYTWPDEL